MFCRMVEGTKYGVNIKQGGASLQSVSLIERLRIGDLSNEHFYLLLLIHGSVVVCLIGRGGLGVVG